MNQSAMLETLLALKWAELEALAALLTQSPASVRALARMRPDRWVAHVSELALLDDYSRRLGDDYRELVCSGRRR